MNIPEKIFKAYDIRGIYPEDLNEENIVPITKAIYKFLTADYKSDTPFKFAIGQDMRLSTPVLFEAASKTLVDLGAEVIDLGLVSTPTFYFAIHHFKFDGGFVITASHNPKEYNGIKIIKNSPKGLIKIGKSTGMDEVKRLSLEGVELPESKKGTITNTKQENILDKEIEHAKKIAGNPNLKPFKVVADPANAMGALYIDALFKTIPGELIRMNFELDGTFPAHQADPLQFDTLEELQKKVLEEKADLGLAPDGDGDRLFFIDERGEIVPPSLITALVAKELLSENPGEKVLFDIRYVLNAKNAVEKHGGIAHITKVGHAFITEQLHQTGGIFAGESSAHYFFRDTGNAEGQLPVILIVLKVMSRERKKLSKLVEELRSSVESGEINFKVSNSQEVIEAIKEKYKNAEVDTLDGVAVSFEGLRFSIRTSNTEPLLRLNVEGLDKEQMHKTKEELISLINQHAK